ncbi:piezo-type mechanosensitive ion channel component 2-like [Gigantopelta aegis]|uniref:piezo-type mechanosensitive ion channel component 2-like n=1 Tax=Gigantopelta aegis TaxID=1735272 RepID=UPI001B88AF3C|nr:piezo-type mechanosensitive ion channel component 2-like [Gigantopelta aegis]
MRHFYARKLTYAWWPIQLRQKPKELARAGFCYTGDHDAITSAIFRFNGLSFLYTAFLLISPLLSVPCAISSKGSTGVYLKILIAFSTLAVLAQATFHIVLGAIATDNEPYGSMFPNCSFNEKLARQVGLQRLDGVALEDIIRLIVPDVVVFIVSLVVFIISNVLLKRDAAQETSDLPTTVKIRRRRRVTSVIEFFGEFLVALLLCVSGIILPSVLSAVYFLTFLVIATLWACYKSLGHKFAGFRVFLLVYTGLHILVLHLYQFQFFQEYLPHTEFLPR